MRLPSWLVWYKKPEYRDIREYADNVNTGRRAMSPDGRRTMIPSRLRLDRILQNRTCSPMSLYDFYMYLKHIEFSAENLEFYMWYKNYEASYAKGNGDIKELDYGSIPSASQSDSSVAKIKELVPGDDESFDPEIAKETLERIAQLIAVDAICSAKSKTCSAPAPPKTGSAKPTAADLSNFQLLNPTTGAVARTELDTIVELFLSPGGTKELNIPPIMRQQAIADLQNSTHPAALKPVADHVYGLLRNCSHRNLVRLGVSNDTFETICVATALGFVNLIAGFLVVLLRGFVPYRGAHSMFEAFCAWPLWWLGMTLVLSGLRGSCFFLLLFSRRQALPWERFDDSGGKMSNQTGFMKTLSRLMIFDRRLRVKEKHLRRLQQKIVLQSIAGGSIFACACVLVFIFLPMWRETIVLQQGGGQLVLGGGQDGRIN
ncbi:hypothetical protein QBC37DRAFT_116402 [Rhypophila decipiens]|uniref:RGS domain-containing protein n=1 Tax=Rhypophila decipiens TaxID=261697 RepID=A0AAN6XU97_9PEZI|nr:hypothetical protein QBC37DRAFT_116402 [Rhypophila decipiens]